MTTCTLQERIELMILVNTNNPENLTAEKVRDIAEEIDTMIACGETAKEYVKRTAEDD